MLILLSPAKRLNQHPLQQRSLNFTTPELLPKVEPLLDVMKTKSQRDLKKLMKISDKIALENVERFKRMTIPFPQEFSKPAAFLFNGDAYQGLDIIHFDREDLDYAQEHLRILSGFYGILRPLDRIMPYRLEMGTKLKIKDCNNLYDYWKPSITSSIQHILQRMPEKAIINVASKEYFSAVNFKALEAPVYTMHFKEYRDGTYKFLTHYGKKARGLLTKFIIKNQLIAPEEIKHFNLEGYHFHPELSSDFDWVFTRGDE